MATIDEFKAQLIGGGPRSNRFKVYLPRANENIEFLAKGASIPAATVPAFDVKFRGSTLKLAGDRTYENWNVTIINDIGYTTRSGLEQWQGEIQAYDGGDASLSNDYLLSRAFVEQLGKDDSVLARYEFFNMFPTTIGAIELNFDTTDELQTFEVEFAFSHWERSL